MLNIVLLIALILSLLIKGQFIIAVGLISTIFVAVSAVKALLNRKISVDLLASVALLASLLNREWSSVAFINLMITSARIFGDYTQNVAGNAIKKLLKLRPNIVKIRVDDSFKEISLKEVKIGDLIVVESGDRIPVDGKIIEGEGSVDQSSLTGESIPISKSKGDMVYSSTLNVAGTLMVKAEKIGKDTTLEKIINLVTVAQKGKVKIETLGERFATIYIIIAFVASAIIYFFTKDLQLILAVLLVVCADDIAIAVPMAFWASIGKAARSGIIVKGGEFLEASNNLKTVIFDKTGTLTKGKLKVIGTENFTKDDTNILQIIGSVESVSEHPIAKAIVKFMKSKNIKAKIPTKSREYPGKGIEANIDGKKTFVGQESYLKEMGIKFDTKSSQIIKDNLGNGINVVIVAQEKILGIIKFKDELRSNVKETIRELKGLGVEKLYMLTGDNEFVAKSVAQEVGINDYKANLMPQDKLSFVKTHIEKKNKLAMIGDGVNDAAALAASDIGIAMGAIGSDASIESANVALMNDDFTKLSEFVKLGKTTVKVAHQNFIIWGVVNCIGLVLVFAGVLNPQGAAVFNFVTDFFPIANSLRLLR